MPHTPLSLCTRQSSGRTTYTQSQRQGTTRGRSHDQSVTDDDEETTRAEKTRTEKDSDSSLSFPMEMIITSCLHHTLTFCRQGLLSAVFRHPSISDSGFLITFSPWTRMTAQEIGFPHTFPHTLSFHSSCPDEKGRKVKHRSPSLLFPIFFLPFSLSSPSFSLSLSDSPHKSPRLLPSSGRICSPMSRLHESSPGADVASRHQESTLFVVVRIDGISARRRVPDKKGQDFGPLLFPATRFSGSEAKFGEKGEGKEREGETGGQSVSE